MILRLLAVEWGKVIRRPRTYLGYGGVLVLLTPLVLLLHYGRPDDFIRHQVGPGFQVVGTFFNGLFLARLVMGPPVLSFFVPLFAASVAGDLVAGEAAEGTLRTLLVRPVSRVSVLLAKFAIAMLHTAALTLFLGVASLGIGALFFGVGDLLLIGEGLLILPMSQALLRLAAAYAISVLGIAVVSSLAFAFSTLVDHPIFAIGAAMTLLIVMRVLEVMGRFLAYFEGIRPYLFTTHMDLWHLLFRNRIPWGEVGRSAVWLLGYIVVSLTAALLYFRRKDILC